jgi:uncharacterized SAM-binding protein YcdF (DUF218 family)
MYHLGRGLVVAGAALFVIGGISPLSRKAGFPVEPWPVDYRTADERDLYSLFDAPSEGLKRLEMAVHEWIGLIAYRLMGRSDELFPHP